MIEIQRKQKGKKIKPITIATSWDEIYYDTFVTLMKGKVFEMDNQWEKTVKIIAGLSSNPAECEKWLTEMEEQEFKQLFENFNLVDFKEIKPSESKFLTIDGKKYKIRDTDVVETEWLGQITYERLKQEYSNTEDYTLAFGLILRECDEQGNIKPFDLKTFDYVVNHLPQKVKMVDVYHYVTFFLTGAKKRSSKRLVSFTIKKVQ